MRLLIGDLWYKIGIFAELSKISLEKFFKAIETFIELQKYISITLMFGISGLELFLVDFGD